MPDNEVETAPEPAPNADASKSPDSADFSVSEDSGVTAVKAPLVDAELPLQLEVILLSVDRPMPASKLADLTAAPGSKAVHAAIAELNVAYEQSGRSFRAEQLAGGYQLMTQSRFANLLKQVHRSRAQAKLSGAAMETLAIVAYKQPILRAEVETIRGVASGEVLRALMERGLVKIAGRAEEIGRPILYGTTRKFLEVFGLSGLNDLPKPEQFGAPPQMTAPVPTPDPSPAEAADDTGKVDGAAEAVNPNEVDDLKSPQATEDV